MGLIKIKLLIIILILIISISVGADQLRQPYRSIRRILFEPPPQVETHLSEYLLAGIGFICDRAVHWYIPNITAEKVYKESLDNYRLPNRSLGYRKYVGLLQIGVNIEKISDHIYLNSDKLYEKYQELILFGPPEIDININIGHEHLMIKEFDLLLGYYKSENFIEDTAKRWALDRFNKMEWILVNSPEIIEFIPTDKRIILDELTTEEQSLLLLQALIDYNYLILLEHSLKNI